MALDDVLKGSWKQLKGRVKEEWGDLTDDEVTEIEGNSEALIGKIQAKYGRTRMEAENEVADWLDRVGRDVNR